MTQPASPFDGSATRARALTIHNLKFIAWALHVFTARNGGRLPPASIRKGGRSLLSWRVAILPFLEADALYQRFHFDEAWDSPHNHALLNERPRVYAPVVPGDTAPEVTYYQGLAGPGSLFDGAEGTRIAEGIDADSPTLMIVEASEPVPWTKPEDLTYDKGKPLPKLGGQFEDGFHAAFAEGSVRFLAKGIAPDMLHTLIRRGDAKVKTVDQLGPRL